MSVLKDKAQVIMLPTNKPTGLFVDKNNKLYYSITKKVRTNNEGRHLYIVLDEKIKEGDWYLLNYNILKCTSCNKKTVSNENVWTNRNLCKKIIATTDTSLKLKVIDYNKPQKYDPITENFKGKLKYKHIHLPQSSQGFIKKYIEEYNKGNVITDILVEREHDDTVPFPKTRLKVSKDNTITIHPIKDSWNREELYNEVNTRFTCKNEIAFLKSFIKKL